MPMGQIRYTLAESPFGLEHSPTLSFPTSQTQTQVTDIVPDSLLWKAAHRIARFNNCCYPTWEKHRCPERR
jgi:hypothetical protein